MDWLDWAVGSCIAAFIALIMMLGYGVYSAATAETFELRIDDWACTRSHVETHHGAVAVGTVAVPTTSTSRVCDVYERRK